MSLIKSITNDCRKYIKKFVKVSTIKLSDIENFKRLKLAKQYDMLAFRDLAGIYLFCKKGHTPLDPNAVIYYVGRTLVCVLDRIASHFKSFQNPYVGKESTGRSFMKFNVDTNQEFDIYFISADILGAHSNEEIEAIEKIYQHIFNVVVKDTKHVK